MSTDQKSQPPPSKADHLDQVRVLLAAVDAHVVGVGQRSSPKEQRALELTTQEVVTLLEPYPDIIWEARELRDDASELPSVTPARRSGLRHRMGELTDLIRLQLLASR
jgi:hypothetical protein